MFLDEAIIAAQGGNGGKGCVSWHREKYVDKGGPNGGDGGNGGNVIMIADPNTDTLSDFASKKRFTAKHGEPGRSKSCAGANAEDLRLHVPPGTLVYDLSEEGKETLIADLRTSGDSVIIGRGGRGGYGNAHFKTAVRQAPDFAELGGPGEKKKVKLTLKLVADVGIIGYPSVGKSSLIAAVSKAKPKIAAYPFTTLVPNLGVVHSKGREFVLCDVPGLIEGASEGKGLGIQFLKHIERCGILLHILDVSRDDIIADYKAIRNELKAYSPTLAKKPEYVVLNKVDLVGGDVKPWKDALKKAKIKVFAKISAATTKGTQELMDDLLPIVLKEKEKRTEDLDEEEKELPVIKPHELSEKMGAFRVERKGTTVIVSGKRLEQFTAMTNFSMPGARQRFLDVADRVGLLKAIRSTAKPGDEVFVGATRIDQHLM